MQDVALDKTPCMASPKEEKMDRFELDKLAMMAKKDKSYFPLLLKNSNTPVSILAEQFGFTIDNVYAQAREMMS